MPSPSILLLSHGKPSKQYLGVLRGEMSNADRLRNLLVKTGCSCPDVIDILEIFGGSIKPLYEPLAEMNVALAQSGFPMLDETAYEGAQNVCRHIMNQNTDFLFILSWAWSGAALYATGIHKQKPTATKLYVHHENEVVCPHLYEPNTLLLTEALLANERAIHKGMKPWQLFHLPHHYPDIVHQIKPSRSYVEKLIKSSGKNIKLNKETIVIGSVARLEFGKNCEFALQVVERLKNEGHDVLLIVKGGFEDWSRYPIYKEWLKEVLDSLKDVDWLLWDQEPSSYEEIFNVYASFDLFLHLSGAEAGSNVIVETLSLGIPTIAVEGTTNSYLFKGGACLVRHNGELPKDTIHPFRVPDKEDLYHKLKELVSDSNIRKEFSVKGLEVAKERFCPERTLERLPLMFEALEHYHRKSAKADQIKTKVEALYNEDRKRYGL